MTVLSVIGVAQLKAEWLSQRQVVLSQNIANVNTPGFKPRDLAGFNHVLQSLEMPIEGGNTSGAGHDLFNRLKSFEVKSSETLVSGNSVSLEDELLKVNETNSQYSFSTNVIKSFHRMISSSLKS
jgi:flagellar basal-body rod protein FlgB